MCIPTTYSECTRILYLHIVPVMLCNRTIEYCTRITHKFYTVNYINRKFYMHTIVLYFITISINTSIAHVRSVHKLVGALQSLKVKAQPHKWEIKTYKKKFNNRREEREQFRLRLSTEKPICKDRCKEWLDQRVVACYSHHSHQSRRAKITGGVSEE